MGTNKAKRNKGPQPKPQIKTAATKTAARETPRVSKKDSVIALLRRPDGATIKVMMKATGWQSHSVRGFLAGTVCKKMKLKLQSEKVDGERIYRVAAGQRVGAGRSGKNAQARHGSASI